MHYGIPWLAGLILSCSALAMPSFGAQAPLRALAALGALPAATPSKPTASSQAGRPSDNDDLVVVTVVGEGATAQEAFDDGLRQAVRQAAGAFVRTDTKVENEQIVQDRVLSHSRGFVESVKAEEAQCSDGVCRMRMTVTVRREQVGKVLQAPEATIVAVDGTTIAGRVKSLLDQKASAEALVAALFEDWPANVMKVVVAEGPKAPSGGALPKNSQGTALRVPEGHTYIETKVDLAVDDARWAEWCQAAAQVFEQIAIRKSKLSWNPKSECKPVGAEHDIRTGGFPQVFREYMSDATARAPHLVIDRVFDRLQNATDAMRRDVRSDDGSLKAGAVEILDGTAIALCSRFGKKDVDLYLLPIKSAGHAKLLREEGLGDVGNYPGFAALPSLSCDLLLNDGTSAGSLAFAPHDSGLAALSTLDTPGLSGSSPFFSFLAAPLGDISSHRSDGPFGYLLMPALTVYGSSGGSFPGVLSRRQTLVYGFFVPNEDLINIDKAVVEFSGKR
jgi:hypothetical protein